MCAAGTSSIVPPRDATRTLSTRSPIRRSEKCALPKMAPPTVPGVPAHASSPAHAWVIVHRTRPLIVTAASARTLRSSIDEMVPPRGRITTPRMPASAIRTFEPPPRMVTLTPARSARAMATTISSVLRVSISHWAGPPTRKVVKGANGTWARARVPNASRSIVSKSVVTLTFQPPSAPVPGQSTPRSPRQAYRRET